MTSGQYPKQEWRPNPDGAIRTVEQAVEIARRFGVRIPEDVDFFVDEFGDLDADTTARTSRVTKPAGSIVRRSDLVHRTGKVPFRVRQDIFASDEAIVAVLSHEMYELENLRPILLEGTPVEEFIGLTCPGNPGNLHDRAWDVADAMVERMRGGEKK